MTGHYVWVDGKPYPSSWASDAGHDFIQTDRDGAVVYGPDGRAQVVVPGETVQHFDPRPPMTDAAGRQEEGGPCGLHGVQRCTICFPALRRPSVVTPRGEGFLGQVYPGEHDRSTRTYFRPYVVLADGTREDLPEERNYLDALAQLSERLRKGTPNP